MIGKVWKMEAILDGTAPNIAPLVIG